MVGDMADDPASIELDRDVPMAAGLGRFLRAARSSSFPASFHEDRPVSCEKP
jgi:hypothetical protein